jgi:hypothetical protein
MRTLPNLQQLPADVEDSSRSLIGALTRRRTIWILFSILVVLVWGPRLFRSFWVDEAGTFWMAHDGLVAAIQKTWHWPGQSILYSAIASFFCLNGGPLREFVLRIPSVLGVAAAGYFLYRLAENAIGLGAGLVAVIILAFHPDIVPLATEARPYGLALGAVAASCWYLYRYIQTGLRKDLAAYVVASALIVYLQYLFAMIFCAQFFYLLYIFFTARRTDRRMARWVEMLAAYLTIGLLCLPLFPHMRLLLHEAHTLPLAISPAIVDLLDKLLAPYIAFGLFLAAFLVQFLFPASLRGPTALKRPFIVLTLGWWLFAPVLFFAVTAVSPMRVFVPRYISYSALAQVLLLAHAGWCVLDSRAARTWAIVGVLLSTASPLSIAFGRARGVEELRPFMRIIRTESAKGVPPPVFFCSPLPESNFYNWRAGVAASYLYAPFVAYPVPNEFLPLPYRLTDEVKEHISRVINTELIDKPEVLFITHQTLVNSWMPWMLQRMKEAGFDAKVEQPNAYTVIIFRHPAEPRR